MRGKVLHYDEEQGFGFIDGADGNRYTVRREDLRRDGSLAKGTSVDFQPSGDQAKNVFSIHAQAGDAGAENAAAGATAHAAEPRDFGRNAVPSPITTRIETGLWHYFRRALTANYANFADRARRKEYWGYVLFWMLAFVAVSMISLTLDYQVGNMEPGYEAPVFMALGMAGWILATLVPSLAMAVRRQHDIGISGWFFLVVFIPMGVVIALIFALIPSRKRENKWGPVPEGIAVPPAQPAAADAPVVKA
ncbi:DUF805 domain-containing protein [Mesorhizobium sp. IMUNJ 23232]|uniref:DUF805 domain-containing protein n=1 Tax=Mesorhizobium sp. IMUNJ 23232 TaxID=3376064 RepID=UPI0037A7369F